MDSAKWQRIKKVFNEAIELSAIERAKYLEKYDDEMRFEIEKLVCANFEAENFIAEPALVDVGLAEDEKNNSFAGKQIDAYKIIREIGQGGMGTVYLATRTDESFNKPVALKLIKRGMDTNAVLKRFVMERQILAQLTHPNIANLLDGGSTENDLPYLVMEYVDGEPINKFCDSHHYLIDERLKLFRKVCEAVSYAHQNLIVHRDIKPSNVLVTRDGEPKLLDFGIAKLLHPDWSLDTAEATATMFRVMTPEYASPEQIRGLPVATTTDVYSLGVVLYELLTGTRPYKIKSPLPDEAAQVVLTEEPVRPSSVKSLKTNDNKTQTRDGIQTSNHQLTTPNPKSLRGDLDNIILKALRKEASERYGTVQEFSEDISRFLRGLPVAARPQTIGYRFGKYVKRHKIGVASAAMILISLIGGISVAGWQWVVARRERDRAEYRFQQVRKLAKTVLFEYDDSVAKLAGSTALREKMVKDSLEYLDNLSSENLRDTDLKSEIAAAYEKIGDVLGNPYSANLGNQEGALDSYRKCLAIRQSLNAGNPENKNIKYALGTAYNNIGDVLWAKSDNAEALQNYQNALTIFENLSASEPQNINYLIGSNVSINGIAHVQEQMGDTQGALESYRRNLENSEKARALEDNNRTRRNVAVASIKFGDTLAGFEKYEEALRNYENAAEIFSKENELNETHPASIRELGFAYSRIAGVYTELEKYVESVEFHQKAYALQQRLAAVDPDNAQIKFDISVTHQNLAKTYLLMKNFVAAQNNIEEGIKIFTETLAKNPDYNNARADLGLAYIIYGDILSTKRNWREALAKYQESRVILEDETISKSQQAALAELYEKIGDANLSQSRQADQLRYAENLYQKSLSCWQKLQSEGKARDKAAEKINALSRKIEKCRKGFM